MNIEKLKELIELSKLMEGETAPDTNTGNESVFIGKYVILRCRNAGVHFGKLEYAKGGVYRLSESRRLYKWRIKGRQGISLSELSLYGLDDEYSQINSELKLIEITEREGGEVIPVENEEVIKNFKTFKVYIPN